MKKHRTALGKIVDMSELLSKNERTRAVGNMKVNARGDTIDSQGKVIEPVTNKVTGNYAKTVGNRSAQPVRQQPARPVRRGNDPGAPSKANRPQLRATSNPVPIADELLELTDAEKELEEELLDDVEIESIKAKEME